MVDLSSPCIFKYHFDDEDSHIFISSLHLSPALQTSNPLTILLSLPLKYNQNVINFQYFYFYEAWPRELHLHLHLYGCRTSLLVFLWHILSQPKVSVLKLQSSGHSST